MKEVPGPGVKDCVHMPISHYEQNLFLTEDRLKDLVKDHKVAIHGEDHCEIWFREHDKRTRNVLLEYFIG